MLGLLTLLTLRFREPAGASPGPECNKKELMCNYLSFSFIAMVNAK